jgi:hypothetical protein
LKLGICSSEAPALPSLSFAELANANQQLLAIARILVFEAAGQLQSGNAA